MWYRFHLLYYLSGCPPLQPVDHVVRNLKPQGQARGRFISAWTQLSSQPTAIISSRKSEFSIDASPFFELF